MRQRIEEEQRATASRREATQEQLSLETGLMRRRRGGLFGSEGLTQLLGSG